MYEICDGIIQDLTIDVFFRPLGGLLVRENQTLGVFVDGLCRHACQSYVDICTIMSIGQNNRSMAATMLNSDSSRADTFVTI